MAKNIVIVESPAKAKTIEGYLGKDYQVVSSFGHIRDLPKTKNAIDIEHNFQPTYIISKDKEKIVKSLKDLSAKSKLIYLASDDDREGESIAWHLKEALELDENKTKRIVFREITKNAILTAIENPRGIDMNLVNSQQARRVLDRLVGFDLSPVLWKKIKAGLSAGRVQSVAVKMIVEREREILNFKYSSYYKIKAYFTLEDGKILEAELNQKFDTEQKANEFLENCKESNFTVTSIEKNPVKKSPSPPFTTSSLQQEASQKLGYSVSQTMVLAQKLYEEGKISYMRTDSLNLSDEALLNAEKQIVDIYGKDYVTIRKYKTKSSTAQEAHEAIRPTNFEIKEVSDDTKAQKLYALIRRRALASQMSNAIIEKTTAFIDINNIKEYFFIAKGEMIQFKGFLALYMEEGSESEYSKILPPISKGQKLILDNITARQKFTKPPARFTEAALVKNLEEKGIGRPSTYAPTISTIQKRGYIIKESREGKNRKFITLTLKQREIVKEENIEIFGTEKNKLFPTDTAMVVNDFLEKHFPNITSYGFTALMETKLDEIAQKHKSWQKIIEDFYNVFRPQVEKTEEIERAEVNVNRVVGTDPKTGKSISAKIGRYGPFVQMGEMNEATEEKPRYASLRKGQFIETITLDEALELFKLPREIGSFEDTEMSVNIGRFGPYVKHQGKFYSIPKDIEPLDITKEQAIEIIENKREADKKKTIKIFDEDPNLQVLNGRFGPYIKFDKKNIRLPKDIIPEKISYEECKKIVEEAENKPKSRPKTKKK